MKWAVGPCCTGALLVLQRSRAVDEHSCFSPRSKKSLNPKIFKTYFFFFFLIFLVGSYGERAAEGLCFFFSFRKGNSGAWIFILWGKKSKCVLQALIFLSPSQIRTICRVQSMDFNYPNTVCSFACSEKVATSSVFLCLAPETVTWVEFQLPITDFSNYTVR